MPLSLHVEMKGEAQALHKERHPRRAPTVPSLGNHPPHLRPISLPRNGMALCRRNLTAGRVAVGATANSGFRLFNPKRAVDRPGKCQGESTAWPSLRRPCGYPSNRDFTRNQTFCGCKRSRTVGRGILKGDTVGVSLEWRSFGTFLSPRREKYVKAINL